MEKIVKNGIATICLLLVAVIMMLAYVASERSTTQQWVTTVVVTLDMVGACLATYRMWQ